MLNVAVVGPLFVKLALVLVYAALTVYCPNGRTPMTPTALPPGPTPNAALPIGWVLPLGVIVYVTKPIGLSAPGATRAVSAKFWPWMKTAGLGMSSWMVV